VPAARKLRTDGGLGQFVHGNGQADIAARELQAGLAKRPRIVAPSAVA